MSSSGGRNVVDDLSPQLGGDLDANGFDITGLGHVGFLATQDPSAGANDLDDYEEGTFTPTILDQTLSPSEGQTYTRQDARYVKVGRAVFILIDLTVLSLGTLTVSQQAFIGGLPFVPNASGNRSPIAVGLGDQLALNNAGESMTGFVEVAGAYIPLYLWDATTGNSPLLISEFSTDGRIIVSGHYEV